jgi:hypothetical protein
MYLAGAGANEKLRIHLTIAAAPIGTLVDVQPLEETLHLLGRLRRRCAHAFETMATAYFHARQPKKSEELSRKSLEIAKGIPDESLCARAVCTLSLAQMQTLQLEEALKSQEEAIRFARATGEADRICWPLVRRCLVLISRGRLDDAERAAKEACDVTHSVREWDTLSPFPIAYPSPTIAAISKDSSVMPRAEWPPRVAHISPGDR